LTGERTKGRGRNYGGGSGGGCTDATRGADALGTVDPVGGGGPATGNLTTELDTISALLAQLTTVLAGGGAGATLISAVSRSLQGAPIADQVLGLMSTNGAPVDVISDGEFSARYGRAAGIYDPSTNRIAVPASVANNPVELRLILLHEGVHWLQDNVPGGIAAVGGPVAQALASADALRDVDPASRAGDQQDEAQAYLLEAVVAKQLGIRDGGMGSGDTGTVLSYDETLANVVATPEYQ